MFYISRFKICLKLILDKGKNALMRLYIDFSIDNEMYCIQAIVYTVVSIIPHPPLNQYIIIKQYFICLT